MCVRISILDNGKYEVIQSGDYGGQWLCSFSEHSTMKEALALAEKALLNEKARGKVDELSQEELSVIFSLQPSY